MDDDDINETREWLASEKAGIAYFEKLGQEYPGHLAINKCEAMLNEVVRLRERISSLESELCDLNDARLNEI